MYGPPFPLRGPDAAQPIEVRAQRSMKIATPPVVYSKSELASGGAAEPGDVRVQIRDVRERVTEGPAGGAQDRAQLGREIARLVIARERTGEAPLLGAMP